MVNFLMQIGKNTFNVLVAILLIASLSACVTQQYKEDKTLIITNDANKEEIAMTRISLGLGYLKVGNTTQAKLNLEKAKRVAPDFPQVYTAFAHYYDSVGEPEQAIAAYEKALSIKSDDADTLNNYGVFLCRQGHVEQAEKQLLKAINVPSYLLVSQSYENIALCQLKNNNFIKAEKYLKKSIEHSPNNVSSLINMARLQYAKGDYKAAEKTMKRFEKATRRFTPEPLALAFKIYQKLGRHKAAKSYAAMLVKMYPQSYQAKQYLLNGLQHSEIDSLAASYKKMIASQRTTSVSNDKKRVIKLSPKTASTKIAQKDTVTKQLPNTSIAKKAPVAALTATVKVDDAAKKIKVESTSDEQQITKKSKDKISSVTTKESGQTVKETAAKRPNIVKENKQVNNTENKELAIEDSVINELISSDFNDAEVEHQVSDQEIEAMISTDFQDQNSAVTEQKSQIDPQVMFVDKPDNEASYSSIDELPVHKIRAGENLFKISKKYNIRIRTLRKWNNLTEQSILRIGDTIYLADPNSVVNKQ